MPNSPLQLRLHLHQLCLWASSGTGPAACARSHVFPWALNTGISTVTDYTITNGLLPSIRTPTSLYDAKSQLLSISSSSLQNQYHVGDAYILPSSAASDIHVHTQIKNYNFKIKGWGDGSVAKSTYCSCGGLLFSSQDPWWVVYNFE